MFTSVLCPRKQLRNLTEANASGQERRVILGKELDSPSAIGPIVSHTELDFICLLLMAVAVVLRVFGMLEPGDNSGPYESEADPDVTTGSHDKGINGSRKNLERRETGQNQVLTPTAADGHSPPKRSLLGDLGVNGEDNEVKSLSKRRIHHKPRSSQVIILTDSEDSSEGELVGQGQKKPVRNGNAWPQQSTSEEHEQRRKRAQSEIKREEEALDREEETFMKELKRRREEIAKSKRYVDSC